MCYSLGAYNSVNRSSRVQPVDRQQVTAEARLGGQRGPVARKQRCLCSPTSHPGSFRCRYHQAKYQWVGRFVSKAT
ncbi:hypothetical protein DCAR_0622969 [Daucus carota subsp. sativus]|uniref:Uncharacterized protein n=1 Tax=Daucus carota subsp. sativus TaxID=79200 RepID=A0A164UZ83_DAUCS|nr:hypothetical protein DCAR_0622969 [Daucus carota subsp. sativus]